MKNTSKAIHAVIALLLTLAPFAMASTTWYVNGVNGSDNHNCLSSTTACKTIGHVIALASSGDFIKVGPATYRENLTIGISLSVAGSSAATTIIDGAGKNTVLTISNAKARVSLSKLTIRNGSAPLGGGINNSGALTIINSIITANYAHGQPGRGAGIYNTGTLTINFSSLTQNMAMGYHCNIFGYCVGAGGAAIDNEGARTLIVNNSTISGNSAQSKYTSIGGGILNNSSALITNSTLSGNSASIGGGIESPSGSTLNISSSTVSGNSASTGGGISAYLAPVAVQNTIVANNGGGNCNGTMTSNGYNLSSDNTCGFNGSGDMNNVDPLLGPLTNNGGPTQTMALPSASPASDAGNPSGCTDGQGRLLTTDQRGLPRPDKEDTIGCDIGAYERQAD